MQKNVGSVDKSIRIVAGLVLIAMVFVGPQTPWGWIGIIPLATAFMSWCPLYSLLGMRTCPAPSSDATTAPPEQAQPPAGEAQSQAEQPAADEDDSDANKPL